MKAHLVRMTVALAVLSVIVMMLAGAHEAHGAGKKKIFTKHFNESPIEITKNASYSIEILLDDKEYDIGKDVTGIVVHNDKDVDVAGAVVFLVLKNLDTGTPDPATPTITDKGNGLYIVKGLDLLQKGRWELTVTVSKAGIKDHAVFFFPDVLKERYKKGRYSP